MRRVLVSTLAVVALVILPSLAFAQATITGVIRDTTGAVLPGVTVEAASPALIERSRTATTDGTGQYRLLDLRSGQYVVTATLQGYTTFRREALELAGTGTFTINIELKPGAISETVTVVSDAPMVDVQSVTQQHVITRDVIDAVPTGRTVHNVAALIPGMVIGVTGPVGQDVGGSTIGALQMASIHGGRTGDQRVMMDGLPLSSTQGNLSGFISNIASTQEFTIDTSGVSAEDNSGGVRMNIVPREGGNTFRGSFFFTGATDSFQATNVDQDLLNAGYTPPDPPKTFTNTHDLNVSFGGPVMRDKLWFYTAYNWHQDEGPLNGLQNANAGDPNKWTYEPLPGSNVQNGTDLKGYNLRLTYQAPAQNKVAFYFDRQDRCRCPEGDPTVTSEAEIDSRYPGQRFFSLTWTSVISPRLLLDAAYLNRYEKWGDFPPAGQNLNPIQVTDSILGVTYHGQGQLTTNKNLNNNFRGALSFVTGAHSFKFGGMLIKGSNVPNTTGNTQNLTYAFENGRPVSLTMFANPTTSDNRLTDGGLYVQDRWTTNRLTVTGGLRFDYFQSWFPEQTLGPGAFLPNRNISTDKTTWVTWKDVTPRLGATYDVRGNGKTAARVSINKYLTATQASGQFGSNGNPLNRVASSTARNWNDFTFGPGDPRSGNFVPDCNLTDRNANGECGGFGNQAFGTVAPALNIDPELANGWGVRGFNWEFQVALQQELMPRVSMEVAYVRRWYGNFTVTDNLSLAASDFDSFQINAPADQRLPDGGSYRLPTMYDVKPDKFGQTSNFLTLARKYGDQTERWHGVDLNFNLRLSRFNFQGGTSTGTTLIDNCEILAQLPEITTQGNAAAQSNAPHCRTSTNWLTQVKGMATYSAMWDITLSAGFQSLPGPLLAGTWSAPATVISPALGRPLSGNATSKPINLLEPGQEYQPRSNQVDLRIGKVLRFGERRTVLSLDLFNAFNANPVLGQINNYGPVWLTPLFVLPARLAKISVSMDF